MLWLKRYWPLLLGLLYLANPFDVIHDLALGPGQIDDILVLLLLTYWWYRRGRFGRYGQQRRSGSSRPGQEDTRAEWDPYEVLGISPGATQEEIRSAYRRQAQRYHPDRVTHLGEEFQEMAKQKFQEIQNAYEMLSDGTG
jgi:hypothetical protein